MLNYHRKTNKNSKFWTTFECAADLLGQNSPQWDDKNMLGNIGDLFVKCMRLVTKGHLYHLLGVSDYYVK